MTDLKNPAIIWTKGALFLVIGFLASAILVLESPSLKTVALLALAVWSFCRSYYFAFYVIEKYVDDEYRFSGLLSFARYIIRNSSNKDAS